MLGTAIMVVILAAVFCFLLRFGVGSDLIFPAALVALVVAVGKLKERKRSGGKKPGLRDDLSGLPEKREYRWDPEGRTRPEGFRRAADPGPSRRETGICVGDRDFGAGSLLTCRAILDGGGEGIGGELFLTVPGFVFRSDADEPGHPRLSCGYPSGTEPFSLADGLLEVQTENGEAYRFILSGEEAERVRAFSAGRRKLASNDRLYGASVLESCAERPWPGIVHPFMRKRGLSASQVDGLFSLLTAGETYRFLDQALRRPLPWLSEPVFIRLDGDTLTAEFGKFTYTETPELIHVEYYDSIVGFFDDSGHEDWRCCMIEDVSDPGSAAGDGGAGKEAGISIPPEPLEQLRLQDPVGMKGAYRITRHRWGVSPDGGDSPEAAEKESSSEAPPAGEPG